MSNSTRRDLLRDYEMLKAKLVEQRKLGEEVVKEQEGIEQGSATGLENAKRHISDLQRKLRKYTGNDPLPLDEEYYRLRDQLMTLTHQRSLLENARVTARNSVADYRAARVPEWTGEK